MGSMWEIRGTHEVPYGIPQQKHMDSILCFPVGIIYVLKDFFNLQYIDIN